MVFLSTEVRANIFHSQTSFNLVATILQLEKYGYRASKIPPLSIIVSTCMENGLAFFPSITVS